MQQKTQQLQIQAPLDHGWVPPHLWGIIYLCVLELLIPKKTNLTVNLLFVRGVCVILKAEHEAWSVAADCEIVQVRSN